MEISVVVPAYNRADLLPATLDAILAQSVRPHEVIVVDDGSHDATPAVLRGYEPRVRAIRIENGGDLVARNTGLRAASGDLVAFCDSDDLWRADFLETMAAFWRVEPRLKAAWCDFVIVRGGIWETASKFSTAPAGFWDGSREVGPELSVFDEPVTGRLIRFQPFFASCVALDRRFFLEIGGWDEAASRIVGCDFATTLRVGEHAPIGVIRRPLAGIRKHGGNFSGDVQAMNLGDARILEMVLAARPGLRALEGEIRASIVRRRTEALDTAFARRDFTAVREIAAMLPPGGVGARVKRGVAALPEPTRGILAGLLLALGSARAPASS